MPNIILGHNEQPDVYRTRVFPSERNLSPMKFSFVRCALIILVTALSVAAQAADVAAASSAKIKEQFTKQLHLKVQSVEASPVAGLLTVLTDKGLFYTNEEGSILVQGNMFSLSGSIANLTEQRMSQYRLDMLQTTKPQMIVFPAKNEKHVVTVFTDVTCGYCRRLHSQIDEYNKLGITIRYLAYPRAGEGSKVAQEMADIWCSKDPKAALTAAKKGVKPEPIPMCNAPIAQEYELGESFGINGTPALILDDGQLVAGYLPPQRLLSVLEQAKG